MSDILLQPHSLYNNASVLSALSSQHDNSESLLQAASLLKKAGQVWVQDIAAKLSSGEVSGLSSNQKHLLFTGIVSNISLAQKDISQFVQSDNAPIWQEISDELSTIKEAANSYIENHIFATKQLIEDPTSKQTMLVMFGDSLMEVANSE